MVQVKWRKLSNKTMSIYYKYQNFQLVKLQWLAHNNVYLIYRPKWGQKSHILCEVREEPEMVFTKCQCPKSTKHNKSYNCQCNYEDQEPSSSHTQVVNPLPAMQMSLQFHFPPMSSMLAAIHSQWMSSSFVLLRVPLGHNFYCNQPDQLL